MQTTDTSKALKKMNVYDALSLCCISTQVNGRDENIIHSTAQFIFSSNCIVFAGHFPEKPILPAVVQLTAIRYTAEQALKRPLQLVSCGKIKFSEIIQPDEQVEIEIALNDINDKWHGVFTVRKEGKKITSGSCDFRVL
ncbi:hypothetical protein JWG39_07870 [Desulforhopalus vacuolatus]|uniref:hypothetical protein n=1 Tax=Desulforhopalus vacuolatus TaxID=40414 RepID=UPI001962E45A|nr:hypothetical protein [Desulforhopalus vacuolatus]MBM9519738.1 hypothetical protein [Desulforhopalus vacuolatus]